jgi:hypothetical protein
MLPFFDAMNPDDHSSPPGKPSAGTECRDLQSNAEQAGAPIHRLTAVGQVIQGSQGRRRGEVVIQGTANGLQRRVGAFVSDR